MPIQNGAWVNYTFSNCQMHIINGNIVYTNVSLSQLNASGLLCSIAVNFPWFWVVFMIVIYIATLFLFSYLNSIKLFTVSCSMLFSFATILLGYGFINPMVWFGTLCMLILSVAVMYLMHQR